MKVKTSLYELVYVNTPTTGKEPKELSYFQSRIDIYTYFVPQVIASVDVPPRLFLPCLLVT
jgi:hypothetical protein